MRARGYRLSARTLGLALVAAVIALQAFLALHSGVAGIPGLFVIDLAGARGGAGKPLAATHDGGESVFAKSQESPPAPEEALAEATGSTPPSDGEPNLEGLAEIPLKPWVRDDAEPEDERRHVSVPAGGGQPGETLPWDAVEPVPFDATAPKSVPTKGTGPQAPSPQPAPLAALPADTAVASWVKAKATEIKGIERARPLYHFEFWLEPPANVKGSLATVTYEFNTPAVMPQTQMSREQETGFRISAGGLACADKVTVTLKFRDGRSRRVEVDGCKLVS